jgi:hypothetical protein
VAPRRSTRRSSKAKAKPRGAVAKVKAAKTAKPKLAQPKPAAPALRIAFATEADAEPLARLLVEMYRENGVGKFNAAKTWGTVRNLVENGIVILIKCGDVIVASAGYDQDEPWYSDGPFLRDSWVYVHPAARRSHAFMLLMRATKRISDDLGLPVVIQLTTPVDLERKTLVLQHCGFKVLGNIMVYTKGGA